MQSNLICADIQPYSKPLRKEYLPSKWNKVSGVRAP